MKANSDTKPKQFIKARDKTLFNFNITKTTKEDIDGTSRPSFDFEYVEIKGDVTRDKLVTAMIRDKYSIDEEFALINNKFKNKDKTDPEYDNYQSTRAVVKEIAKTTHA